MKLVNRRHFFHAAGLAITAAEATRVMGANDRIRLGLVGLGNRGSAHNALLTRNYRVPYVVPEKV